MLAGDTGLNGSIDATEVGWLAQYASVHDGPGKGSILETPSIVVSYRRETVFHEVNWPPPGRRRPFIHDVKATFPAVERCASLRARLLPRQ